MLTMLTALLCLTTPDVPKNAELQNLLSYQRPGDVSDLYLNNPYSMDFSENGRLYVIDANTHKVHMWGDDGKYIKSFGNKGEGPGEMINPFKIEATADSVYVWAGNSQMSIFDLEGTFKRSFKVSGPQVRNFAALNEHLFLMAVDIFGGPTDARVGFQLVNDKGEIESTVKEWKNDMILAPIKGNNNTTLKAFGAEADIQEAGDGNWYFGYSSERVLYKMNSKGEVIGEKKLELPTAKPTDSDRELYNSMSFPGPGGQRLSLKDLPNLKVNYTYDKAYYTQFTVQGKRGIFVLHPLGGTNGVGIGYSSATYVIVDMDSGNPMARGRFAYSEDSRVLFRNGRILALVVNDEDGFDIRELGMDGFQRTAAH